MTSDTHVLEVPLGAIQPGPVQFIRQVVVEAERDLFELTLPGQITRCGGAAAFAVKATGRVIVGGEGSGVGLTVSARVSDEPGLSSALGSLLGKIELGDIGAYAIRLASKRASFSDMVARAEEEAGDCGCGGKGSVTIPGVLGVGFGTRPEKRMQWSDDVRVLLKVRLSNGSEFGKLQAKAIAVGSAPNATACSDIWHGIFDRWTECRGPCSSGTCACRVTSAGTPVIMCSGWTTCTCQ